MPLHLYRQRRADCAGGHAEDSCAGPLEERRKGWRRCECAIDVSGTLNGKFSRRSTGRSTWDDARSWIEALETSGTWSNPSAPLPPAAPTPETPTRVTVVDALARFLANR